MKINITKIHKLAVIVLTLFLFSTACNQNKTIPIKVALVYKMGAQPVARAKFYLLKKDLESLKDDETLKRKGIVYLSPNGAEAINSVNSQLGHTNAGGTIKAGIAEDVIRDFIVATAITDFEGNAKFENVPKGIYYIAGYTTTRSESGYAFWSVKTDTENVKDVILLDQDNAFDFSNY